MAFIYPDLTNPLDAVLLVACLIFAIVGVFANALSIPFLNNRGGLLSYSKFAANVTFGISIPSKWGMFLFYFPSMCFGIFYYVHIQESLSCFLAIIHFAKRTLECLMLHRFSGTMPLASSISITSLYLLVTFSECYYVKREDDDQNNELSNDLHNAHALGLALFAIGASGNLYHHYLLANLRRPGEKAYKVPEGGLFRFVAAPHYLFEVIGWLGIAAVSQHMMNVFVCAAQFLYLADRAKRQTEWYLEHKHLKDKYPKDRKHLIPYIY